MLLTLPMTPAPFPAPKQLVQHLLGQHLSHLIESAIQLHGNYDSQAFRFRCFQLRNFRITNCLTFNIMLFNYIPFLLL